MVAGDHVPLIPLVEVVGRAGGVLLLQAIVMGAKVGVVGGLVVTVVCAVEVQPLLVTVTVYVPAVVVVAVAFVPSPLLHE